MQSNQAPTFVPLPFAANGLRNVIPEASQAGITPGAASFNDGFPPSTMQPKTQGGVPPDGKDFNGILYAVTQTVRWVQAGGQFLFSAAFATDANVGGYPKGAVLVRADYGGFWFNEADNNTTNPDATDGSARNWLSLNADWNAAGGPAQILHRPTLATVATSGSYNDLTNKPAVPPAQVNSDWNAASGVAAILNKPFIPPAQVNSDWNASSGVAAILNKPDVQGLLGFTPVQQGGGSGMGTNKVYIGWSGSELLAQVDGSPQGYLWTSVNAPSGIGQNGWQRFPSGLYLQWGMTPSIATDGTPTFNFPIAFPNAAFGIVAIQQAKGTTSGAAYSLGAQVTNSSSFSVSPDQGGPTGSCPIFWIALGV
ncbi:gp53-like domain-containing protein [Paraburkholderia sp. J10-1]|uniref:gp53-like domain-containing protein n=1 Tax=Paraburkholderia sp. J10-1 TaxID=2805430 RepID=UPI002AB7EB60|nr:hypothetical protein [Paraburkholderia sp. J10-1]